MHVGAAWRDAPPRPACAGGKQLQPAVVDTGDGLRGGVAGQSATTFNPIATLSNAMAGWGAMPALRNVSVRSATTRSRAPCGDERSTTAATRKKSLRRLAKPRAV
jgi:hypothetical protein